MWEALRTKLREQYATSHFLSGCVVSLHFAAEVFKRKEKGEGQFSRACILTACGVMIQHHHAFSISTCGFFTTKALMKRASCAGTDEDFGFLSLVIKL